MWISIITKTAVALPLLGLSLAAVKPAISQDQITRGEYLATIMDCGGCHTAGALVGKPDPARYLAGSQVGFQIPGLGIFYPPTSRPIRRRASARGAKPISSKRCAPVRDLTGGNSCRSCRIPIMAN